MEQSIKIPMLSEIKTQLTLTYEMPYWGPELTLLVMATRCPIIAATSVAVGIEIGMRIMQARFDAVAMINTPQYRNGWSEGKAAGLSEGWSDAIEAIRTSLKEFPNCGGDVVIIQEVQRLIGEAVAARGQDPWQGVTG